ncbi:MAG: glutamate 5-kinase, partial [Pseudomonadota bacterium]
VGLGRRHLAETSRRLRLDEKQAAAALGQVELANGYREVFARAQMPVAQVLLTFYDTENRRRYLNARRTIFSLLAAGAVPVVNENDTVATEELRYGDNDRLAARVAQMIDARLLVLLSDVDGLYTANPSQDPAAEHVADVPVITDDIARMAGGAGSSVGTGGMHTKILAARIAVGAGCGVVVADGRVNGPISAVRDGARHTWFAPSGTPGSARKRWIAGSLEPRGTLHVDAGARDALLGGRSLLCVGVQSVSGQFDRGDAVRVACGDDTLGVGLCAYDHADAARLAGASGGDVEARLGYPARPEMIHRDDLVLHATEACA